MTRKVFPTITSGLHAVDADRSMGPANDDQPLQGNISAGTLDPKNPGRINPAVVIALAVRLGLMGEVTRSGVPEHLRRQLRDLAAHGDPAARMVLDWLDRLLLRTLDDTPPDGAA